MLKTFWHLIGQFSAQQWPFSLNGNGDREGEPAIGNVTKAKDGRPKKPEKVVCTDSTSKGGNSIDNVMVTHWRGAGGPNRGLLEAAVR